ncbi:hypothetical protein [Haloparvum sp. AD34]
MYTAKEILKAIKHPVFLLRELNILYHTNFRTKDYNKEGTNIFNEDWDNLILLDACRFDILKEEVNFEGDLESRRSRGATSSEFIRGNFSNVNHHDTVYVTGNGWYFKLRDEINADLHAEFNIEHHGIDPSPITEAALEANRDFPNKKLIIHYMHPHYPYTGESAKTDLGGYDLQTERLIGEIQRREISVSDDLLREAYVETVDRVLNEVEILLNEFEGKTVISSDHGELLGDRCYPVPIKDYAHHAGLYVEELVKVPWFVHNTGDRKEIIEETPEEKPEPEESDLDERLRLLGYKV